MCVRLPFCCNDPFIFFFWSWKRKTVFFSLVIIYSAYTWHHISPLLLLSLLFSSVFSELFWRTVSAMGLCQEGWEPHEEPIWEYYCMCVQSTSSALMNFCVPFPFFWLIYWPVLWLWITISCSNRVLLSANESSFDLSNLLLYSSSRSVFLSYEKWAVRHMVQNM